MAGAGTYSAYIPLKPTELKVGDMYGKFVDDFIKRGEAEKAAKAKALAEEKKNVRDIMKGIKTDPFATVSNFQDMGNRMFHDVSRQIAKYRMLAETDFENRYQHIANAQKLADDYKMIATSFGNKDFIDKYNAKMTALQNNDLFLDSSENERLQSLSRGMWDYRIGEKGIEFALPNSGDSTLEEYVGWHSVGSVLNLYTAPDELDMLRSTKANGGNGLLDSVIPKVAKEMQDAYSHNSDGNKTTGWKGFAEDRAGQWFDNKYGEYEANSIPIELRQYAKRYLKRGIESKEDYDLVRQGLINEIGSYVPREDTTKTKYTQAQEEGQKLRNILTREQIAKAEAERKMGYPTLRKSSSSSGGSGKSKTPVNIINGQGVMRHWGNQTGNVLQNATIISKDGKETILAYKFLNQNGKGYHVRYATGLYDTQGRIVFKDWDNKGSAYTKIANLGIDPLIIEKQVLSGETAMYNKEKHTGLDDALKPHKGYKPSEEAENSL